MIPDSFDCLKICLENDSLCSNKKCRYFVKNCGTTNCILSSAMSGPKTLQEIGDIFGISRMRVCQIEKSILQKLSNLKSFDGFLDLSR